MTNLDNDFDNDGNNIVPCPICDSAYCPSKEKGKCPEEDDFVRAVRLQQLQEEGDKEFDLKNGKYWNIGSVGAFDIKSFYHIQLKKAFKAGQQDMLERVREIIEKERHTWAKESIGDKALQSLEMAVETLKALDNLN
jgi:hypothetical protein